MVEGAGQGRPFFSQGGGVPTRPREGAGGGLPEPVSQPPPSSGFELGVFWAGLDRRQGGNPDRRLAQGRPS